MAIVIGGREHITIGECAQRLGIGYRAVYDFTLRHSIPKQKIGRQFFVCFDDLREHHRYVRSNDCYGKRGAVSGA